MWERCDRTNFIVLQKERLSSLLHDNLLLRLSLCFFDFSAAHRVILGLQTDIIVQENLVNLLSLGRTDHFLLRLCRFCLLLSVLLRGWSISILILSTIIITKQQSQINTTTVRRQKTLYDFLIVALYNDTLYLPFWRPLHLLTARSPSSGLLDDSAPFSILL